MISGLDQDFQIEIKTKQDEIDATHAQLREVTLKLSEERRKMDSLKQRIIERNEMAQKCHNLQRAIIEENGKFLEKGYDKLSINNTTSSAVKNGAANGRSLTNGSQISYDPDVPYKITPEILNGDFKNLTATQSAYLKTLPSSSILQARATAYERNEKMLDELAAALRGRSLEIEADARRLVSICTNVQEEAIDHSLEGILQSVESDSVEIDPLRLQAFMRKVDETTE